MKKNDLIKALQNIPGNPDIVMWNGVVQDFIEISNKISSVDLVRINLKAQLEWAQFQKGGPLTPDEIKHMKKCRKNAGWSDNHFVNAEQIQKKIYAKKTVYVLDSKRMKRKFSDRLGQIEY